MSAQLTDTMAAIDRQLAQVRRRLQRLPPVEAADAVAGGAVLVDIRPAAQRAAEGEVPCALIVERNVLEWRFDPSCSVRLPEAGYDRQVIVMCQEGYTSSLAAACLQDLGVSRATDLDGGFAAWRAAGLPTQPGGSPALGAPPVAPASAALSSST